MSYIGSTPTTQSFIAGTDYFNGTGSAVSFTLSRSVNSVNDIEVIVNNVEQIPSGYSVSGTTLTFSAAPSAGTSNVYVRYLSTTNLSLAIPSGTSATFNTVTATTLGVTGVATFAAGTAALPAITTTGDTNTGIFFPAADTIAFAEGGAEAMRIDSSGNVGIGTSSPTSPLEIVRNTTSGGAGAYPNIRLDNINSAGYTGLYFQNNGNNKAFFEIKNDVGALTMGTANTERARIDSSGNLLLGVTSFGGGATIGLQINATSSSSGAYAQLIKNSSGTEIFQMRCNGGLANFSANNVNLSDERTKTDIQNAGGYLAKICAIPVRTFKYKDQTDDLLNLGCIAQEVEAIAPELVDPSGFGETPEDGVPLKAIYQTDLQYALMKCIQEQQALITALTTRITALENNNATQ